MQIETGSVRAIGALVFALATMSCTESSTDDLSISDGGTGVSSTTEALYRADDPPCPAHEEAPCPEKGRCEIQSVGKVGNVYESGCASCWWCASDDGTTLSACSRSSTICRLPHDTSPGTPGQCDTI